jgi:hypothetical protein
MGPCLAVLMPIFRIELHGGFDHYGYQLIKDEPNARWVLEW